MKLAVLRSRERGQRKKGEGAYVQKFDTRFAERVLGNLRGEAGFCTVCGPDCTACRERYGRRHGPDLAAVIDFPAALPCVLEDPGRHVPGEVPPHDVLLVIHIHEQILIEVLRACAGWGTKAVVVPLEAPDWVRGGTRATAREICERLGVEIAFPKPFCSFRPPRGSLLAAFRERFHIGCPDVRLDVAEDGRITDAFVNVSAACGATYCVARWLAGRNLRENIEIEVISKRWHSYPCTASMERDPELAGETALHVAGQAHYAMLAPYKRVAGLDSGMVVSPLGAAVQKPVAPRENLANIERAKALILDALSDRAAVALAELRRTRAVSVAALNSALVILKQQGAVETDGARVLRPGARGERT